ncbi:DNA glycosylase [Parasponia andersonii]|uniref:DNA glycosylase n=1 Tax=Parasponia andersonii TaxID=3476 RepID=A0A2P5ACE0_PARAD|nr:DNA glycosylase [Parasponia andersonii]
MGLNFGEGFSIPGAEEYQFESSWVPATPEKPPIVGRPNLISENPQGRQLGLSNWPESASNSGRYDRPNYDCLAQIFNANSRVGQNSGHFGNLEGNPTVNNPRINGIAGSHQQSSSEDFVDFNNVSFMQLLQHGSGEATSLLRYVEMAAERPLKPRPGPEKINFQQDCSSGEFDSGSRFISSIAEKPDLGNAHYQVGKSWNGSNSANLLIRDQSQCSSSNALNNGIRIPQILSYDFPKPSNSSYDLNYSPSTSSNALVANSLHFTPVTPDHAAIMEIRWSEILKSAIDESASQERDRTKNLLEGTGNEAIQQHHDQLLQNIVDSSSTGISTPYKESKDSDKIGDLVIDLNKTPQQKAPKRRKHRPKVIVEGKQKRGRKPAIPKNTEPKENQTGKRKYVRKNVPKDSTAQVVDISEEIRDSNTGTPQKSCKRVLNFDLEKTGDEDQGNTVVQQEVQNRNGSIPNATLDYQATELCKGTNDVTGTVSSVQSGIPKRLTVENHFMNQMPNDSVPSLDRQAAAARLDSTREMQMKFFNVPGRQEMIGNVDQLQKRKEDEYILKQQHTHAEGIVQDNVRGKENHAKLQKIREPMKQNMPQPVPKTPSSHEARGSKRGHCHTIEHAHLSNTDHVDASTLLYRGIYQICTGFSQTHKKKRVGDDRINILNMPSNFKAAEGLGNVETTRAHDVNANGLKSKPDGATLKTHFSTNAERENNDVDKFTSDRYCHSHNSSKQQILTNPHSHIERMGYTRAFSQVSSISTGTTIEKSSHLIPSLPGNSTGPGNGQLFQTCYHSMSGMKHTARTPLIKTALSEVVVQEPSAKRRGPKKKQIHLTPVDEVIHKFQSLNLNGSSKGLQQPDQNALVLYKGNRAVVPYEGFEFIKKRKPRPKVDLDPDTNRIWNLLMGKEGIEDLEGTDPKKEKWWEEERKVFSGRVDSFIARMHLVQGDRRFSRWKGSVVDSVIGVFLTQNVSDHLSSSAFMSLAARFPLTSTSCNTQDEVNMNIIGNEATIPILNPDNTIKWHEVSSELINNENNTPHQSTEHQWGDDLTRTKGSLTEAQSQSSEELILSQDSFDSSVTQAAGGIRSSSGSNSEAEDPCTGWKPSNVQVSSLTDYQQMEKTISVQEVYGHVNRGTGFNENYKHWQTNYGQLNSSSDPMRHLDFPSSTLTNNSHYLYMQPVHSGNNELCMRTDSKGPEVCCFETFSEESTTSWHSTASRSAKGPDAVSKSSRSGEQAESFGNYSELQNQLHKSQETPTADPCALLRMHLKDQGALHSNVEYSRSSCNSHQHDMNNMFQVESTSLTKSDKLDEALTKMQGATEENVQNVNKLTEKTFEAGDSISTVTIQLQTENKLVEPNSKEQSSSSDNAHNGANIKIPKAKKGNAAGQKKNEVDWDILRKQAETSGAKKERSEDAMDSLDYEAVRKANVNEISNAIKERGMNNMLAERIQEFLNRLVRDHGSIDLEWLRDVPPDKAKDYLLSIRGLGLKSVECVRLLTLHHLAFPSNPPCLISMFEKVDTNVGRIAVRLGWVPLQPLPESLQLHLLELARLALPGPEERRVVSSTVPITPVNYPAVVTNPALLPPPENHSLKEAGFKTEKCEPIIEEPATPEQECTEVSQSDIEDSFYEDPDEIPTIKLNMEEFTETLQNYMQKNMELQEVDMSKALVALNPEAASIPIPKLKNVSRLRTEHQVYELPDSHPLLERLDRREPDDPSPYLLAIWTPGETANSIQPPVRSCSSHEPDKLCNEKTCFSCNSVREANSQTVRGTILIPCRTAMRGSFPLNGTYFQVNEVFADHESSLNPINVPREWLWNLPRRMVYFGTSVSTIFKGLSTEGIQFCFWKGFVCVRGFDLTTRAPRPLMARLHFPASKLTKNKNDEKR